jgi:redox-sensitive bicupin YhaK (pirin superfamily)
MDNPEYQEYGAADFPIVETPDYTAKVLIGQFNNVAAPIKDDITNLSYFDVQLNVDKRFHYELPEENNSFIYVFEGSAQLNGQNVPTNSLIALGSSDHTPEIQAGESGARFIVVSGKPINEPVVQYGPFVMNTREEINQAMQDFQSNNFVRERAWVNRNK